MKLPAVTVLVLALLAAPSWGKAWDEELGAALRALSRPLHTADDLAVLRDAARRARLVLLGEATHGTREFYAWRDLLTRRLLTEQAFSFIAVEGDWASLIPLDRYVRLRPGAPASAQDALSQIRRWPRWVWVNRELAGLAEWLRDYNAARPAARRVGIHGIDLYAVWESLEAVLAFYRERRPESLGRVARAYGFLRGFRGDHDGYVSHVRRTGGVVAGGVAEPAEDLAAAYRTADRAEREALLEALQHARVVMSGERYLRLLPGPARASWNTRAAHFADTLLQLLAHYGPGSRAIVWAHNTHIGDARATEMAASGEVNLGQLARQRHGVDGVFAVGFGTATGQVTAARRWEGPHEVFDLPPPRRDSLEAALLASGAGDRLLLLDPRRPATAQLRRPLPHRAIGVVFDPRGERRLNYVPTRLADRYDAFVFLPHTSALAPLPAYPVSGEPPLRDGGGHAPRQRDAVP